MSKVTVSQAAQLTGKTRETINKATRKGRLSYTLNSSNHKVIDVSELERVFPLIKTIEELNAAAEAVSPMQQLSVSDTTPELALLQEKLASSKRTTEMLIVERDRERRQLEEEIENLRSTLAETHKQHSRALAVITDQTKDGKDQSEKWERFMRSAKHRITRLQQELEEEKSKTVFQKIFG